MVVTTAMAAAIIILRVTRHPARAGQPRSAGRVRVRADATPPSRSRQVNNGLEGGGCRVGRELSPPLELWPSAGVVVRGRLRQRNKRPMCFSVCVRVCVACRCQDCALGAKKKLGLGGPSKRRVCLCTTRR